MYEIELKARVENKTKTTEKLNSFAKYITHIEKNDVYWLQDNSGTTTHTGISVRIREEIKTLNDATTKKNLLVTHKRKKLEYNKEGSAVEVNQEYEFELTDRKPFEVILEDSGYHIQLRKSKSTDTWEYDGALFELSTIPYLGDYLEIEILTDKHDEKTVTMYKKKLFNLLEKSGLTSSDIENRYYSEMIENLQRGKNNV
ncbi:MAG: hypothetical protein BKP49_06545 [Treponema sp. CETP13]|nr:MAG: hypothetical protein BKP49_06545 [Treponema sp. CETP13]